jgi:multidrug efflux pump subunit AcrA (membrane-fusion protein)
MIRILFYLFITVFAQQPPAPQVRVMTIEEQNVVPADEYVGHVEAIQSVELRARVAQAEAELARAQSHLKRMRTVNPQSISALDLDNADRLLLPGQYVTVQVRAADPKLMPVVPQSAVLVNQEGRYVLTVKDGIATPQPIVTGTALDRMWAVESGLETGDQIIVSGIQKVQPGQPVTVLPANSEN